jgi:hypothetical protein
LILTLVDNSISSVKEHFPRVSNKVSILFAKSFCIASFQLLQFGYRESQKPRTEKQSAAMVGNIIFERMDQSIPGSQMKNLHVPTVDSEGFLAIWRGRFYRSIYNATSPIVGHFIGPNESQDEEIATNYADLAVQWGALDSIRSLPMVPPDLQDGANRGDRLGAILGGQGLFIQYLRRTGPNDFLVDLTALREFPTRGGFHRLGFKAELKYISNQLQCVAILLGERKVSRPSDECNPSSPHWADWKQAQDIALATLLFDVIAIQHLLGSHLINASLIGHLRNTLKASHPIARLVDPNTVGTIGIHFSQVPLLIGHYSFLSHVFPYEQHTINKMIDTLAARYNFADYDIERSMKARNMDKPLPFETPFQDYMLTLFKTYKLGVSNYVHTAYSSDQAMQKDPAIMAMIKAWSTQVFPSSNHSVQSYFDGRQLTEVNRDDLTNLLCNYVFFTTVTHEVVGNGLLQYALQGHLIPAAVPEGSKRMSLRRYLNLASILLWTSLPKEALGHFLAKVKVPESTALEGCANQLWASIAQVMKAYPKDSRLPGTNNFNEMERSVNQ